VKGHKAQNRFFIEWRGEMNRRQQFKMFIVVIMTMTGTRNQRNGVTIDFRAQIESIPLIFIVVIIPIRFS
jgi:hypothetical protein